MEDQKVKANYPPLSSSNFDRKRFQKELKNVFRVTRNLCRFGITGNGQEFDKISKDIIDNLRPILLIEDTYRSGNLYFILTIINNHQMFLAQQKFKLHTNNISKETIEQIQQEIIDQHEGISEALVENLKNPVNYDTLPDALGLSIDELEDTSVE